MASAHDPSPPARPRGARRVAQDPWEAVLREELRRLRRHTASGRRVADIGSRSAQQRDDADRVEPLPSSEVGDDGIAHA